MRTSLSAKFRAVIWVGIPAMVLLLDLLGAGKLEMVRSGGCDIATVDCDCVCMVIERLN